MSRVCLGDDESTVSFQANLSAQSREQKVPPLCVRPGNPTSGAFTSRAIVALLHSHGATFERTPFEELAEEATRFRGGVSRRDPPPESFREGESTAEEVSSATSCRCNGHVM